MNGSNRSDVKNLTGVAVVQFCLRPINHDDGHATNRSRAGGARGLERNPLNLAQRSVWTTNGHPREACGQLAKVTDPPRSGACLFFPVRGMGASEWLRRRHASPGGARSLSQALTSSHFGNEPDRAGSPPIAGRRPRPRSAQPPDPGSRGRCRGPSGSRRRQVGVSQT
jgi:hypothetical protein